MHPVNIPAKFEVHSLICSWDNRGYSKNLGSPCIRPCSIFSQIFNWLLFACTLWIYLPNLTFVALPIPDIIGCTSKIWGVPGFEPRSLFSQIFKGLLFAWTLRIYLPSLKFIALSVPELIGGTRKIWAVPVHAHAPFSSNFFMGLCSDGPCKCIGQIFSP